MFTSNDWDRLWNGGTATVHPIGEPLQAELVEKVKTDEDSYGYLADTEVSMIFKVGEKFYKLTGYVDSYGDNPTWEKHPVEVQTVQKYVTTWERV